MERRCRIPEISCREVASGHETLVVARLENAHGNLDVAFLWQNVVPRFTCDRKFVGHNAVDAHTEKKRKGVVRS